MDIKVYNTETFKGTELKYPLDSNINLKDTKFFNEQNLNLNFSDALTNPNDIKVNNFSALFLSNRKKLDDVLEVEPLTKILRTFSTPLAFDAVRGSTTSSKYWSFDEGASLNDFAVNLAIENITETPANRNFFEITFLNDLLCTITHNDKNVERFVTLDYTFNLNFAPKYELYFGTADSPQSFYYFYDEDDDLLVLYKKVLDFPYYITFTTIVNKLKLKQPPLGPGFPFPVESVIRLRPHSSPSNSHTLDEFEAKCSPDGALNSFNTEDALSRTGIKNNYLLHTEYSNITSTDVNVNLITLKNELAPGNNNARNDQYINDDTFTYRDYKKIFSGTYQTKGNDNIQIAYDGFTSKITFKPDKLTYFHTPYDMFPFTKVNVNDTNLVDSGAIAGDHPVKADKIFKMRGNYKDYTPFGTATDENNGVFLCAWLSGVGLPAQRPVWVDRYYNPSKISFISALTSIPSSSAYKTNFEDVIDVTSAVTLFFDKPSDLYLEPGVYYAYQHIGPGDIQTYNSILDNNAVQKGLVNYYVDDTQLVGVVEEVTDFVFNGQQYSTSVNLADIGAKNVFTISFDINSDFKSDFGNLIVGNFVNNGFGLFNQNYITPFLTYFGGNTLYILNTQGNLLNQVQFDADIKGLIRKENLKDYYVILADSRIVRLAIDDKINFISDTETPFSQVNSVFYNTASAVLVVDSISSKEIVNYSFSTNEFAVVSSADISYHLNIPASAANAVVFRDNLFYATSASNVKLRDQYLYYQAGETEIRKWSLTASPTTDTPFFSAAIPFRDFNIDKAGNFWLLFDSKVMKYDEQRQYILSAAIDDTSYDPFNIDFVNELRPDGFKYYANITSRAVAASATGLRVNQIDEDGVSLSEFDFTKITSEQFNMNVANGDFNRREIIEGLQPNTLNVKAGLTNIITKAATELNLYFSLSATDNVYQSIAIRYDGNQGQLALFVNGKKENHVNFDPAVFSFGQSFMNPFVIGTSPFVHNVPLPVYLKNRNFYVVDSSIKNFRIFDTAVNDSDILMLANGGDKRIDDIIFNIPAGKRSFIDELERVFKLDVPRSKSNALKIKLKNTGIINEDLQDLLKTRLLNRINQLLPYSSEIVDIEWIN